VFCFSHDAERSEHALSLASGPSAHSSHDFMLAVYDAALLHAQDWSYCTSPSCDQLARDEEDARVQEKQTIDKVLALVGPTTRHDSIRPQRPWSNIPASSSRTPRPASVLHSRRVGRRRLDGVRCGSILAHLSALREAESYQRKLVRSPMCRDLESLSSLPRGARWGYVAMQVVRVSAAQERTNGIW
jgi:hypothetical protein